MSSSKSRAGDFPKTELKAEFPKMEAKPLDFLKKEAHEFPKTELGAGKFPKMEVKPLDFLKMKPHEFPKKEASYDFPNMEQNTLLEKNTHTSFLPKKESEGTSVSASGTSNLSSSESTIAGISSYLNSIMTGQSFNEFLNDKSWHYQDPTGKVQGPFSMLQLYKWNASGHFPPDLRIWWKDEKQDNSILLTDALSGKCSENVSLPYDSHPACSTSTWQPIIGEPTDFSSIADDDESVSELLAEVEAMESLGGGLESPTSIMKCGKELTDSSKNDCLNFADGLSPVLDAGDFPKTELEAGEFPKMEVKPLDFLKKESHEFTKTELGAGKFPKMEVKPLDFLKKESHEFPETELGAGKFPKMEVKPLDFLKMKLHEFPKEEASYDFPKMDTFLETKTHTSFLPKKESERGSGFAFGTSKLESSESTISRILSRKSLMWKRDLMSLLRSYPPRITSDSTKEELYDECSARLIPMEIIRDNEKGEGSCSIFNYDDDDMVPEAILNLAVDLAVHQLIQTLISISNKYQYQHPQPMKYIRLSTRSDVEKRAVMARLEAALNDKHHMLDILNSFRGTLSVDASTYPTSAENQFRQHICQQLQLQLPMNKDNDTLCTRSIKEEMSINRYLVLLVDRDGGEAVHPWEVGFPKTQLAGVLVLITTESTTEAKDDKLTAELMDLEIRTRDHLLSWEVFCHNVGKEFVYASSAILTIAVRIVEECHGHLLAIVLVAKWLLKNLQDVKHWELALHKILHTNPSYDIQGHLSTIMKNTFLNLIWDSINKMQKHCLRRCLFIPEIRYGKVDSELMNDWTSSLSVEDEESEQNLRELLDNSILLQFKGIGGRYIQLPEETYKILQSIYTLNSLVVNISGRGLTEPPNIERWQNALQIDLADNKLSELPLSPDCLYLKVLMLQRNAELTEIPSSFFIHMPLLQILDLSYTSVRELPSSLFFLVQLREFYLKGCECFMKLPPEIGNLQKLEKLDLDETQITHLPEEVQKLTNMKSLTLYFYEFRGRKNKPYSCSTIIPSGVLSKLKRLKHLRIGVNPDDERWHDNVQVILREILGLELLEALSIYIPQLELLKLIPAYILLEEVDFRFIVGRHMQRIMYSIPPEVDVKFKQSDCSMKFVKGEDVPAEIKTLLRHSKALFLDRHITIKNLSDFGMKNLEQLRVCILAECKELRTIVGGGDSNGNGDLLPHLLFLSVSHMKNLRSIWEGPTVPRFLFGMLQCLSLQSCPKLITLLSLDFLGNLSLLKELLVKDCPKLSTLINRESSKRNAETFLPKLRKLSLLHLPELSSISSGLHIGPGLKEVAFYDCPKLRSLSKKDLSSKELVAIKGETKWWNALKGRQSKFDKIFFPIHAEVDVMTQLGIYNDDDIENGPGVPVGKPSQPTSVATPVLNSPVKSRRGVYKRRRSSQSWTTLSPSPVDNHTWRKYAQKDVLNMKYPRSYFRCTHKYDQGCRATKQVQRVDDEDPPLYRTAYIGLHICNAQQKIQPFTESDSMGKHTDPNPYWDDAFTRKVLGFKEGVIKASHEEADVMTQLGIFNDDDIDIDDGPGPSSCGEARSPGSNQSLQERSSQDAGGSSGTKTIENISRTSKAEVENPSKKPNPGHNKGREIGTNSMEDMPCVFTKGDGPNGRRIDGILYRHGEGEEVRIMCACHGDFLSPAEFVKHAGGSDVTHPLKHIVVYPL